MCYNLGMDYRLNSLKANIQRVRGDLELLRLDCSRDMAIVLGQADDTVDELADYNYDEIEKALNVQ